MTGKSPPRVVLDTNVVLSALLFGGGPAARVRAGWQSGRFAPLASTATAQELVRVLGYPKFRLSAEEREELLADFMPWVEVVQIPDSPPAAPACRDPFDLPFLHLALAGRARAIVTGDRDLLVLARTRGLCPVLGVDAFCRKFLRADRAQR
ncbi:MAG: putative toxin-antitoxin system toxin component, PIN family [Betaproteobacteria bacterium PRO3]|nr:putative toxin-antitoxin system toxin component, PIN family [Betaproteobacteria bacterium PRO3]